MARRSARLSNRDSSTPRRVSLSHDEIKTPRTMPARLAVVHEGNEIPGGFPDSASRHAMPKQARQSITKTPSKTTPIQPSSQEMHPQHHQQSTAKPLDEARHLGFSNMGAYTAPPKQTSNIAMLQCTPSKSGGIEHEQRSPSFQFTFRREHSLELSPQAKKLMNEKREEAAKIRQQMIADGQGLDSVDAMLERKIAIPKSQKGRFGQVHQAEFDKMDSIAGHASAFRANPSRPTSRTSTPVTKPNQIHINANTKSLKRSPSKAGLDEAEATSARPAPRFVRKTITSSSTPPPPNSSKRPSSGANKAEPPSAAKRVRIAENGDVSTAKRQAISHEEHPPTTPGGRTVRETTSSLNKKNLATPTQSSLTLTPNMRSVKASRIPGPFLSVSKPASCIRTRAPGQSAEPESPLLSRSPAKITIYPKTSDINPQAPSTSGPLLSRTPIKLGMAKMSETSKQDASELVSKPTLLLSRSPTKPASPKKSGVSNDSEQKPATSAVPLLAQSPVKGSFKKADLVDQTAVRGTSTPLFAKSPSKIHIPAVGDSSNTLNRISPDGQNKVSGRPKLLQVSPMKSILRSPQRLFSDDPAKLAAGTHFATPPLQRSTKGFLAAATTPNTAQKRVEFTSSTKADEEPSSRGLAGTSSRPGISPLADLRKTVRAASSSIVEYPTLPADFMPPSPSPQKRRQTGGPLDFTFRAGDQDIVFGPSPGAPKSIDQMTKSPTIRHVPSGAPAVPLPVTGSKKRKFDFENMAASSAEPNEDLSDKENTPAPVVEENVDRPAKRSKLNTVSRAPKAVTTAQRPAGRVATLGVKPKKDVSSGVKKRPNAITQSRLNALAQPKRRN